MKRNFSYEVAFSNLFDLTAKMGAQLCATQIIMDLNGDTRHDFDAKDVKALLEAERRFKALTGSGFTAATRTASGEPVVTRTFDPFALVTLLQDANGRLRQLLTPCLHLARGFREWYLRPSIREQRGLKLLREWLSQEQLVPRHSDYDWLILSQSRMGKSSGAARIWMLRATPG